ncbi:MAG: T9SS type A sorting domain-containing protein, partial [Bacteroidota bacterium]|nr:T9SS type A sorting domain-containing protein [Bacteroidota bacterium]MDX5431007.1 T9SS type A sorting domain-containing protein [Bacteroidota bacterium]MDX5469758.1 T9SS type A sorting domain-containing protein [Bacteroidota bacterium]
RILYLQKGVELNFPDAMNSIFPELAEFKMTNAKVEFENGGKIDLGCAVHLENVDFNQFTHKTGLGLQLHGQASVMIKDCAFNYFSTGLNAKNNDLGHDLTIENTRFYECSDGIVVEGKNFTYNQGSVSHNGFGLTLNGNNQVELNGVELMYNDIGLETAGNIAHIRLDGCWFLLNKDIGINDWYTTDITIECTPFEQNETAIISNGRLNMSPNFQFPGQSLGGGNNTFFDHRTSTIELHFAQIYLDGGNNNFISPIMIGLTPLYLRGTLQASPTYIPTNILDVSGNYFDQLPLGGISNASGNLYSLTAFGGIGPNGSPVLLSGNLLTFLAGSCYPLPRIYPDKKAPINYEPTQYEWDEIGGISNLKAYPNPSNGPFMIELQASKSGQLWVEVYDLKGLAIHSTEWTVNQGINRLPMNLETYPSGTYLIRVRDEHGNVNTLKVNRHSK